VRTTSSTTDINAPLTNSVTLFNVGILQYASRLIDSKYGGRPQSLRASKNNNSPFNGEDAHRARTVLRKIAHNLNDRVSLNLIGAVDKWGVDTARVTLRSMDVDSA